MKLKHGLMIQSLSPLPILTIIRNFEFVLPVDADGEKTWLMEFVSMNWVLIAIFAICFFWIIVALVSLFSFKTFTWTDKKSGYQLESFEAKEDAGLNFFLTMIVPLLIDDVGTKQGAMTFVFIVIMMMALLSRTSLYYANPVLAILGYNVYEIQFVQNQDYHEQKCLCVVKGYLHHELQSVEYKEIDGNVLYMKEKQRNDTRRSADIDQEHHVYEL